jgi:hypothetical protein
MTMRFFRLYEYLAPLVLFPVSYYLWLSRFDGRHDFVLLALSLPVVFAYVIPGLGTNWLKLWEFNTRLRLGRFRAQHGFVFGSATSLFALLCMDQTATHGWFEWFRTGFIMASVLAFWNWLYDIHAIRAGLIVVYNLPYSRRQGPEAIATAYAPVFFGSFGACYGIALSIDRYYLLELGCRECAWPLFIGGTLAVLIVPVVMFVLYSYATDGVSGLEACHRESDHPEPMPWRAK